MEKMYMIHNIVRNEEGTYDRGVREIVLIDEFSNSEMGRRIFNEGNKLEQFSNLLEGSFVKVDANEMLVSADNTPLAIELREINNILRDNLQRLHNASLPTEYENVKNVYSYHVNVGHGNCSIIVFEDNGQKIMWMVDCSVHDFLNGRRYTRNLEECLKYIKDKHGVRKISKLFITHPHYDHINGIEYLLDENLISGNYTEVWLNYEYEWSSKKYNSILARMKHDKFSFILPIAKNSTSNVKILFPVKNICNPKNIKRGCEEPADKKVNNASIVYQFVFGEKSIVFPGDLEIGGWKKFYKDNNVRTKLNYYCISHHGSKTGLCRFGHISRELSLLNNKVLMGRDGAYSGIFSNEVKKEIGDNIVNVEDPIVFLEIDWKLDEISKHLWSV